MNCFVYRSEKKQGMYLYLRTKDDFDCVPAALIKLIGEVTFSFDFDLSKKKKLVKAEADEVMRLLSDNGYFLQMPPSKSEIAGLRSNSN